jgi:hypothetical protein
MKQDSAGNYGFQNEQYISWRVPANFLFGEKIFKEILDRL